MRDLCPACRRRASVCPFATKPNKTNWIQGDLCEFKHNRSSGQRPLSSSCPLNERQEAVRDVREQMPIKLSSNALVNTEKADRKTKPETPGKSTQIITL